MRIPGLVLILASLALPAWAQDLPKTLTGDLDGDGVPDRVELRAHPDDPDFVDVSITLSASKRTLTAVELSGAQDVQVAEIAQGELHLAFGWYQGRYKSSTDFYIGLRGRDLVVRRYKTAVADSISTDKDGGVLVRVCDADFIANRTTVDDKPAAPPGAPVPLAKWTSQSVPAACRF